VFQKKLQSVCCTQPADATKTGEFPFPCVAVAIGFSSGESATGFCGCVAKPE
jgi:hypothetical protein